MAVPKRKTSKSRKRKRRSHHRLKENHFIECSNCKEPKLPHHICLNCGYYKGKQIIKMES